MTYLIRYWFEFEITNDSIKAGVQLGCGVTAFSYSDALNILAERVFKNNKIPTIKKSIENIDIRRLDQNHIVLNMWTPNFRGVWFPIGYHDNF